MSIIDYKESYEKLLAENEYLRERLEDIETALNDYKQDNMVLRGKLEIVYLFLKGGKQ